MPGATELEKETRADDVPAAEMRTPRARRGGSRRVARWLAMFLAFVAGIAGAIWWTTRTEAFDPRAGNRVEIADAGTRVASDKPVAVPATDAAEGEPAEPAEPAHPLDPALAMAREALERIDREVQDYTARVVMQEQVRGELLPESEVFVKIRHDKKVTEDVTIPFGVYLRYDGPPKLKGREAIWVRGWHEDNLVAHESGLLNVMKVYLEPTGDLAMMSSRYPIYNIGLRNLVAKLIERGERERATDPANCVVTDENGVELNGRTCRVIRIRHPEKRDDLEFSLAEIFIDEELQLPVRYAGYTWGEKPGDPDQLLESYTYLDVKVNVGLTDQDFMADNEEYNYPGR